jgi:hypothetical protein
MKTLFKFLTLGTLLIAFSMAIIVPTFAQTPDEAAFTADKQKLYYDGFLGGYKSTDEAKRKMAFDNAREFIKKYTEAEKLKHKEEVEYNRNLLKETETDTARKAEADAAKKFLDKYGSGVDSKDIVFARTKIEAYDKEMAERALFKRFNDSYTTDKWAEAFASGKEILVKDPDQLNVEIILASAAYDQANANPPVYTFNSEGIGYAKSIIQKVEAGKSSEKFGPGNYAYQTAKYTDGKSNILGWMNYIVGFLMQNGKPKFEKDVLTQYQKALQYKTSEVAGLSDIDSAFAKYYLAEFNRLGDERSAKIKAANDEDTDETKAILALQKGYAERAIDAYARASDKSKKQATMQTDPKNKDFYTKRANSWTETLSKIYGFRFDKEGVVPAKEIQSYVASVLMKPMPDVNSAVTPVVAVVPVVAVPPVTKPMTTTTPPATMPAKPTTTTPATPTMTKPAMTKPSTAKPVAKKPMGKKK